MEQKLNDAKEKSVEGVVENLMSQGGPKEFFEKAGSSGIEDLCAMEIKEEFLFDESLRQFELVSIRVLDESTFELRMKFENIIQILMRRYQNAKRLFQIWKEKYLVQISLLTLCILL